MRAVSRTFLRWYSSSLTRRVMSERMAAERALPSMSEALGGGEGGGIGEIVGFGGSGGRARSISECGLRSMWLTPGAFDFSHAGCVRLGSLLWGRGALGQANRYPNSYAAESK